MADVKNTKTKKILNIIGSILIWIVIVFSVVVISMVLIAQNSRDGVPALFGKALITISSPSMTPTYEVGDLVFMTKLSDEEKQALQPGDIITYRAPIDIDGDGNIGDLNTHRIVSIAENGQITTKGDYKGNIEDQYTITVNDIIGKCTDTGKIGGIGNIIRFLQTSLGFFLCIILPLILFFLYELFHVITLVVSERPKRTAVDKDTEEEIKRKAIEEYLKQQAALAAAAPAEKAPAEATIEEVPAEDDAEEQPEA